MTKRIADRQTGGGSPFDARGPGGRGKALLGGAFVALAAVAAAVVFVLPDRVDAPPGTVPTPAQIAAPAPPPAVPAQPAPGVRSPAAEPAAAPAAEAHDTRRAEAERLLGEALRRLAELESTGVRVWGGTPLGTSLPQAEDTLARANALHDRGEYDAALPFYREAIERLDLLAQTRPERFRNAMGEGLSAYERRDAAAAVASFEIAAAIERGSDAARTALDRARRLPDVLAVIARGAEQEQAGDLDHALDAYLAALSIDRAYGPAKESVERVGALIADRNYRRSVSRALGALDRGEFRTAATALREARVVRPDAPELRDIAARLAAAEQQADLSRLRDRGAALERQEKWSDAAAAYRRALALDGLAAFALRGLPRAEERAQLYAAIDRYLGDPARLLSPAPLAEAKTLLSRSEPLAAGAPVLSQKREALSGIVAAAETPVPMTLTSDGRTDVQIYRVGVLGRFAEKRVDLRPGRYVVVGARSGYRDVRHELSIAPGAAPAPVAVICTERIPQ